MEKLNGKEMLKAARAERGMTQIELAERVGTTQNNLCMKMLRDRIPLGSFAKILDAMDYDVVVIDRKSEEIVWQVLPEE